MIVVGSPRRRGLPKKIICSLPSPTLRGVIISQPSTAATLGRDGARWGAERFGRCRWSLSNGAPNRVFFYCATHELSTFCTYSLGPETPESLTAPARVCTPTLETSRNAHTQTTLSGRPSPPHPLPPSEPAPKPTVPPTPRCHPRAHPATCHGARPRLSRRAPPAGRRCTPPRPGCSSARAGSRS